MSVFLGFDMGMRDKHLPHMKSLKVRPFQALRGVSRAGLLQGPDSFLGLGGRQLLWASVTLPYQTTSNTLNPKPGKPTKTMLTVLENSTQDLATSTPTLRREVRRRPKVKDLRLWGLVFRDQG